jgi:tRNA (cmo5U34)-methyltransferase
VSPSGTDPSPSPAAAASPGGDPGTTAPAGYDLIAQQLIPGYASLARLSVSLLAASPLAGPQGSHVLVAGCGTGAELLEARAQRPDWQLTAVDPSAAMLAISRDRIAATGMPEGGAIDWRQTTVESLALDSAFDGALSVLVLQSLPDDGSKLAFLSSLARTLRPGAQLVLVDLMQPERSSLQGQVEQAWQLFQRASGLKGAAEALASLSPRLHPIGLSRLSALVDAAGFSDPAPVFQALDFQGFLLQRRS